MMYLEIKKGKILSWMVSVVRNLADFSDDRYRREQLIERNCKVLSCVIKA
jgi:hypothetical protein